MSSQRMYELSIDWYRDRMEPDWEPPQAAEMEALFASHGLTGSFWRMSPE